jgi:hypothetical protein
LYSRSLRQLTKPLGAPIHRGMRGVQNPASPPKLIARLAVVGMALAVVALGGLAVWAAVVVQNGAHGLSRAGVQTSGHLRAVQEVSVLDT